MRWPKRSPNGSRESSSVSERDLSAAIKPFWSEVCAHFAATGAGVVAAMAPLP